jgi:phosphatidylserine/phosphatidylglycerophosphate/cardiolipin synthase-like enzyme
VAAILAGRLPPAHHIRVLIDNKPAIAHNRVIVLDGRTVITGSFNFTLSADTRNAENVVVLESADVAGWFLASWPEAGGVAGVQGGVAGRPRNASRDEPIRDGKPPHPCRRGGSRRLADGAGSR